MGSRHEHEQAIDYVWIFTVSPTTVGSSGGKFLAFIHDELFAGWFVYLVIFVWLFVCLT